MSSEHSKSRAGLSRPEQLEPCFEEAERDEQRGRVTSGFTLGCCIPAGSVTAKASVSPAGARPPRLRATAASGAVLRGMRAVRLSTTSIRSARCWSEVPRSPFDLKSGRDAWSVGGGGGILTFSGYFHDGDPRKGQRVWRQSTRGGTVLETPDPARGGQSCLLAERRRLCGGVAIRADDVSRWHDHVTEDLVVPAGIHCSFWAWWPVTWRSGRRTRPSR